MRPVMRRFPRPEDFFQPPFNDGEERHIKVMTFPIYWQEAGVYFCVIWDVDFEAPRMMILNHSLFPELRECIRRDLDDVVGQTFTVNCIHGGRIIRHLIVPTGMAPLLNQEKLKEIAAYAKGLYGPTEDEE